MDLLIDGPKDATMTLALAHGAGAPMDSDFMNAFAAGIAASGHRVVRFEFSYMAAWREIGAKKPPSPQQKLLAEWRAVIQQLRNTYPKSYLAIGGKSLGGRMASLIADEINVAGLVCLGYPFHPPGRPERLRTAHLAELKSPTLIVQGVRDPFGTREEVTGYDLASSIRFHWAEDGDHNLKPRKASGRTEQQNWEEAISAVVEFLNDLA
ncbi:MAG: alpha/beta hydrolase [Gammaproteobacteria bacterium]|nr:alpha/beta hydrolase [Gammaproteobacteria bacterium]